MLIVEMVHKGKGRWEGRGERYARAARARSMLSLGFMRRAAALTKIELYSAPRSGAYEK